MTDLAFDLLFWCMLYVVLLLVIGTMGRQAKQSNTLNDYFLAGSSIGFGVLLFTLFATQYSGNSLSGFPGQIHRDGLSYFISRFIKIKGVHYFRVSLSRNLDKT